MADEPTRRWAGAAERAPAHAGSGQYFQGDCAQWLS